MRILMRVLVACEFSGRVRDAFLRRGHDAYSCDLIRIQDTSESFCERHIQKDVGPLLRKNWDLVIAHPPCTYLCLSGVCWLSKGGEINKDRWSKMESACEFFLRCLRANSTRVAVENPIQHGYAQKIIQRKPDQVIHPYQFGYPYSKATGLWLKGLPPLVPTRLVPNRGSVLYSPRDNSLSGPTRGRERSITYLGIANAMAEQWG